MVETEIPKVLGAVEGLKTHHAQILLKKILEIRGVTDLAAQIVDGTKDPIMEDLAGDVGDHRNVTLDLEETLLVRVLN